LVPAALLATHAFPLIAEIIEESASFSQIAVCAQATGFFTDWTLVSNMGLVGWEEPGRAGGANPNGIFELRQIL